MVMSDNLLSSECICVLRTGEHFWLQPYYRECTLFSTATTFQHKLQERQSAEAAGLERAFSAEGVAGVGRFSHIAGDGRPVDASKLSVSRGETGSLTGSGNSTAGLKTGEELAEFWSPSVAFGQTTPSDISRQSSRMSELSHSVHTPTLSSPMSSSTASSALHTPAPTMTPSFTFSRKNSPTSSVNVDTESMLGQQQQLPSLTQSAVHFQETMGGAQLDPLSQSVIVEDLTSARRSASSSRGNSSPVRMSQVQRLDKEAQMSLSFKAKLDRFISIFAPRKRVDSTTSTDSEDFTEIFVSDVGRRTSERSASLEFPQNWGQQGRGRTLSVGEESRPEEDMHQGASFEVGHEETEEEEEVDSRESSLELQDNTSVATPSVSEQPESDRHMDMTLGVYQDTRRFSHSGAVSRRQQRSNDTGARLQANVFSSSFPGRSPNTERVHTRSRNSCSESDTAHTIVQVKDRLQRLVESTQTISESQTDSVSVTSEEDSPKPQQREQEIPVLNPRPPLHTVSSVDSTMTLISTSPNRYSGVDGCDVGPKSRLLMRRVSVCGRKAVTQSESSAGSSGMVMSEWPSNQANPSPVFLLDQFVAHGEVLHRGRAEDIPLSELEGTDWYFYGGCPHSEEVQMMQSQVALLHGQLLFERHQCLQHARRSRRLLSKARTGLQVTEELVQLVRASTLIILIDNYLMDKIVYLHLRKPTS